MTPQRPTTLFTVRPRIPPLAQRPSGSGPINQKLHDEGSSLFATLTPARFVECASKVLGSPHPHDRLIAAAGIRALGASPVLYLLAPTGVIGVRLYHLVGLMESVLYPGLRALVALAEEQGHCGRKDKQGWTESQRARSKLSSCVSFLATGPGTAVLVRSPGLASEVRWLKDERIAKLRNAIAHGNFRFIEKKVALGSLGPKSIRPIVFPGEQPTLKKVAELLRVSVVQDRQGSMTDYASSSVQYEEEVGKAITKSSTLRSYAWIRETVMRVETLSLSLLFGFLEAGGIHQKAGSIQLGDCPSCRTLVTGKPSTTMVTCPYCGTRGNLR